MAFSVTIQQPKFQKLINDTLGDKELARQFIADITTVVSQNPLLQNCEAGTVLSAGLMATSLKLPLTNSLGFAYVIPYKNKAQFQLGWKGLVQLAQRSGQFKRLGVRDVHKGEYIGQDEFGEDLFKFSHEFDNEEIVGYYAYFELLNGFTKTIYWTKAQCEKHGRRYSKSYGNGTETDNWTNMFDTMAEKTVMKQLLSKYAPLSVELQRAIISDQAVLKQDLSVGEYVDNDGTPAINQTPSNRLLTEEREDKEGLGDKESKD